ncbi:hypothetical protein TRVL_08997 [Trypanosoma vivax]|nr:hypothetical protein TRVL_08997 [Trypanosoma vivax]
MHFTRPRWQPSCFTPTSWHLAGHSNRHCAAKAPASVSGVASSALAQQSRTSRPLEQLLEMVLILSFVALKRARKTSNTLRALAFAFATPRPNTNTDALCNSGDGFVTPHRGHCAPDTGVHISPAPQGKAPETRLRIFAFCTHFRMLSQTARRLRFQRCAKPWPRNPRHLAQHKRAAHIAGSFAFARKWMSDVPRCCIGLVRHSANTFASAVQAQRRVGECDGRS